MKDFKLTFNSLGLLVSELTKLLKSGNKSYRVSVKEWRESRSLSQNALYWKWLGEIDSQSPLKIENSQVKGSELWHEVFKKFYCPEKVISNDKNHMPIKSTKVLDVGEMTHYLYRIEQFCIERGILLTIPEESDYYKYMQEQSQ